MEQASQLVALGSEREARFVASLGTTATWVDASFDQGSWDVDASLWQPLQPGSFRSAVKFCAAQPAAGHKLAAESCSTRLAFVCKKCGANPTAAATTTASTTAASATDTPQPAPPQRARAEVVEAVEVRGRRDETTSTTTTGAAGRSSTTTTTTTGAAGRSSTTTTTTGVAGAAGASTTSTTTTTGAAGASSTTTSTTTGVPGSSTTTTSTAAPEYPQGDAAPEPPSPNVGPDGDVPVAFPPRQGVVVDGTEDTPAETHAASTVPLSAGMVALIVAAVVAALVGVALVARRTTNENNDEITAEAGVVDAQAPQAPAMTAFEEPALELQWDDSI